MELICYSGPISPVPTNKVLLHDKITGAKFQIDISTEGIVRIYTDKRTDRWTWLNLSSSWPVIYILTLWGLCRFLLSVTNIVANLVYPVQGIKTHEHTNGRPARDAGRLLNAEEIVE